MKRLLFSSEYQAFQIRYMNEVLSCEAFSQIIDETENPWIVRGYLSTFLTMFGKWKRGEIALTMQDFVKQSAELFEYGLGAR